MPKLLTTPFASEATSEYRTDVQNSTGAEPNSATYEQGFPPITMEKIATGGKPPKGSDLNGVLYDITDNLVSLTKGARYGFNEAYATAIGGYPLGAVLRLDNGVEVESEVDSNSINPNVDMTGWKLAVSDNGVVTWSGRTQIERNKDSIHVLDFKKNKTDQKAIQDAVNYCIANNRTLDWERANLTSTGNITDFWKVTHIGNGSISRDGHVFYIEPKDTINTIIHVSASGSDSNDGLSLSQPVRSLSKVKQILNSTTEEMRSAIWIIKFASGTYADSTNFVNIPRFKNTLQFIGEGTSRNPQTIFDGNLATYKTAGMYFQNRMDVYLQYICFNNFISGYGVLAEHGCKAEYDDCIADNCNTGFSVGYSSFGRATRSEARNCVTGFRVASVSSASYTPKTNDINDANKAINCTNGFIATRNCYGHFDYNIIEDCTGAGIHVEINSRVACLGNQLKRNSIAMRCWTSGFISTDPANPNLFYQNTTDANLQTYEFKSSSGIVSLQGQVGTMYNSIYKNLTTTTVTNTADATQIYSNLFTAWAGWFVNQNKRVKIKVWGACTTQADSTIALQFKLANTSLSLLSIPSSMTNQPFYFESECFAVDSSSQKTLSKLTVGDKITIGTRSTTIDTSTADRNFTFFTDANGASSLSASITIESVEVEICG